MSSGIILKDFLSVTSLDDTHAQAYAGVRGWQWQCEYYCSTAKWWGR
jgi:hypothetical protein